MRSYTRKIIAEYEDRFAITQAALRVAFGRYIGEHEEGDYYEGLYVEGTTARFKEPSHELMEKLSKMKPGETVLHGRASFTCAYPVKPKRRKKTDIINT